MERPSSFLKFTPIIGDHEPQVEPLIPQDIGLRVLQDMLYEVEDNPLFFAALRDFKAKIDEKSRKDQLDIETAAIWVHLRRQMLTPRDVLLNRMQHARMSAMGLFPLKEGGIAMLNRNSPAMRRWHYIAHTVEAILNYDPVLWLTEFREAALQLDFPEEHVVAGDYWQRPVVWWNERPLYTGSTDRNGIELEEANDLEPVYTFGIALQDIGRYYMATLLMGRAKLHPDRRIDPEYGISYTDQRMFLPKGIRLSDLPVDHRPFWKHILVMQSFMESEVTEVRKQGLPKTVRKQRKYRKMKGITSEVSIVHMRRVVRQNKKGKNKTVGGTTREYNFSWLVTGHMRNQWYPKQKCHRLIYIAPYTKGEGPLRQRVTMVDR